MSTRIETNLAEGSVVKQLIRFSIPFVLSSIVQNLYGLVDMITIGQFAGAASLSGVNTSSSYISAITNVAIGFCNGGTVVIGQYLGLGDRQKLKEVIGTLCTFITLLAVVLMGVSLALCDGILNLLQTPAEAMSEARDYYIVSVIGFVFIFGYNMLSAILRGVGDSKRPFVFVCIACVINIVLDIILVGPLKMGAFGAALATVIAQSVSMLLCIIYLKRHNFVFDFKLRSFAIKRDSLKLLLRVGIPTTIQSSINVFAFTFMTAITNTLGVAASAALAGAQKITLFAILPSVGLGNAISAMCAQNFGADRQDRALHTMKAGFVLTMAVNVVLFVIIELLPGPFMHMFGSDPEMIALGIIYLRICSLDYLFVPFQGSLVGYLIGSGHTTLPAGISICSSFVFRLPSAFLLGVVLEMGIAGVAWGTPIASFAVGVFSLIYYLSGRCNKVTRIVKT